MQTNLEQCPLCGSELSQTKFREIRVKQRAEDDKRAQELADVKLAITKDLEGQLRKQFEQERRAAEGKLRSETEQRVKKALAERDDAIKARDAREAEIRKQAQLEIEKHKQAAEKRAQANAEQEMKKVAAQRDQAAKRATEAEARAAEAQKQKQQAQEEAEKQRQKQLLEQRDVFEKHEKLALLKQQSEFNRERESLQKKLERKTANELGDGGEIDVFDALREAFDGNGGRTTRIPKGENGADILHEVFHKGDACGRIIIDAKNRQSWQNVFVTKLRQDQVEAGAEQAILATTAFPSGKREMCIESGVIVISPLRVVHIVHVLRQAMITMHIKGLSMKERTSKMTRLYKLITSESYGAKFTEANRLTQDILELEVQEKTAHDNVWKKRGALVKRMHNVLREVETEVSAVIEGQESTENVPPIFDNATAAARPAN